MPAGRYLFIQFLRTKSEMGQTKYRSSKKSHIKHKPTKVGRIALELRSESNGDYSKMKYEGVKKSFEKSKNVQEEKRKIVKQKTCMKKTHVYNNCNELHSRAIKNLTGLI